MIKIIALKPWIARQVGLPTSIAAEIKRETEKAYLIALDDHDDGRHEHWIPKSQIRSMVDMQPDTSPTEILRVVAAGEGLPTESLEIAAVADCEERALNQEAEQEAGLKAEKAYAHLEKAIHQLRLTDSPLVSTVQLVIDALRKEQDKEGTLGIADISYAA